MSRFHRTLVLFLFAACGVVLVWQARTRPDTPAQLPAVVAAPEKAMPEKPMPAAAPVAVKPPAPAEPDAAQPALTVLPVPPEVTLPVRQDLRWQMPVPEPVFAGFREWTARFARAGTAAEKAALISEGLALAEERRNQMADLIDQNPRRALELAVPAAVRRQLPADIVAQLEEPVSGRGDLWVMAAVPAPGQDARACGRWSAR